MDGPQHQIICMLSICILSKIDFLANNWARSQSVTLSVKQHVLLLFFYL